MLDKGKNIGSQNPMLEVSKITESKRQFKFLILQIMNRIYIYIQRKSFVCNKVRYMKFEN